MRIALLVLLIAAGCYILFVLIPAAIFYRIVFTANRKKDFTVLERDNKYFAPYADIFNEAYDFLCGLPQRTEDLICEDGVTLKCVIYDAKSDKTAVFLHGYNTTPLNNFCLQASVLYRHGFNAVFLYQRAHGGSGGKPAMGIKEYEDLLYCLPQIVCKTGAKQVLLYGMSMGCSTVEFAADRLDPAIVKGMVLDCGFTSPRDQLNREMKRRGMPAFLISPPLALFARIFAGIDINKNTVDSLRKNRIPALFLHGGADRTVPISRGQRNFDACAGEKYWFSVPEAEHTQCFAAGGEEALRQLNDFVQKYFL